MATGKERCLHGSTRNDEVNMNIVFIVHSQVINYPLEDFFFFFPFMCSFCLSHHIPVVLVGSCLFKARLDLNDRL